MITSSLRSEKSTLRNDERSEIIAVPVRGKSGRTAGKGVHSQRTKSGCEGFDFPRKKALFAEGFFAYFRSSLLGFLPSHPRRHVEDGQDDGEDDDGGHAAYQ